MELAHSEEHTHGCSGGEKGGGENGDGENGGGGACHSSGVDINQAKGHLFLVNIFYFNNNNNNYLLLREIRNQPTKRPTPYYNIILLPPAARGERSQDRNFSNTLDWNRQKVVITHDPCRMA